ncbi:hypothetical protein CPC08DRAFT_476896 [Agrocybe pediades]|nr:hypothetical protein CPC08DRAFT_476896 [Agrocybe pediades]
MISSQSSYTPTLLFAPQRSQSDSVSYPLPVTDENLILKESTFQCCRGPSIMIFCSITFLETWKMGEKDDFSPRVVTVDPVGKRLARKSIDSSGRHSLRLLRTCTDQHNSPADQYNTQGPRPQTGTTHMISLTVASHTTTRQSIPLKTWHLPDGLVQERVSFSITATVTLRHT